MTDPTPHGHDDGTARRLELSGPADPEILQLVHAMLENLWTANPEVSEADRARFETAVIEILANIVEHAYAMDEDTRRAERRFHIAMFVTPREVVATLADNGKPMPLELADVAMPGGLAEHGRGLAMASAALDDLEYDRVDGRNQWRLVCARDQE